MLKERESQGQEGGDEEKVARRRLGFNMVDVREDEKKEESVERKEKGRINDGKVGSLEKETVRSVVSPSKDEDILILDTGGEKNSTITTRAWHMFERKNHVQEVRWYGEIGEGRTCAIVNAATKA
eukprot:10058987-Ditylum_brightwellii.AAC.1